MKTESIRNAFFHLTIICCLPMSLYSPNFETRFTKWISKYRLELEGNFDEVMYAMYDYPTYNVWNHGIQPMK